MEEQHPKVFLNVIWQNSCCLYYVTFTASVTCQLHEAYCFFVICFLGSSKRRRSSFSGGHSSNDEGNEGGVDSPSGLHGDSHSPSVRKQPKRVVKPRVYFDLVDYDSDLDDKAAQNSASPARRRGAGPRFSEGKITFRKNRFGTSVLKNELYTNKSYRCSVIDNLEVTQITCCLWISAPCAIRNFLSWIQVYRMLLEIGGSHF